jgi:hypothetical protein
MTAVRIARNARSHHCSGPISAYRRCGFQYEHSVAITYNGGPDVLFNWKNERTKAILRPNNCICP